MMWHNRSSELKENERFSDGIDFAILQFCEQLGIDRDSFSWDGATEDFKGDVRAVIGNCLTAGLGEFWPDQLAAIKSIGHRAPGDEPHARDGWKRHLADLAEYQEGNAEPDTAFERDAKAVRWAIDEIARLEIEIAALKSHAPG